MFFKNIILYRLLSPFPLTAQELNTQLKQLPFLPCPRSENASFGWVSPYENESELLVHSLKNNFLFAFCKEEKILPGSVIREELAKKIDLLQKAEDRIIYRKEKKELREQIIINLRHQAFSRKKITFAYIDATANYLIIDTSSRNKAEEISAVLRKTLGSLKLALPETCSAPVTIMTSWLLSNEKMPSFSVENNCDMLDPKQKTAMIKCTEQDLNATEIINHLRAGKQVVKIAMNWREKISFDFSEDLKIQKIKFLNLLQAQSNENKNQGPHEQLDTNFAIMTGEFSHFLQELWSLFDGLIPLPLPQQ